MKAGNLGVLLAHNEYKNNAKTRTGKEHAHSVVCVVCEALCGTHTPSETTLCVEAADIRACA